MKGSVYLYAENPIGKHADRYIVRRTAPRMILRIMDNDSARESIGSVVNKGKKEYLVIDQIIDNDATESSINHSFKRALSWYKAYIFNHN